MPSSPGEAQRKTSLPHSRAGDTGPQEAAIWKPEKRASLSPRLSRHPCQGAGETAEDCSQNSHQKRCISQSLLEVRRFLIPFFLDH